MIVDEGKPRTNLVTPSLVIARLATQTIGSITGLLLVDIALTFDQPVGIVGQMRTMASLVGVIFAIFMGVLSVRYNHKSLTIFGLLMIAISALGCWIAPSFLFILLVYPLSEIGNSTVRPMSFSLVGSLLPKEKRSSAISLMLTGMALVSILGGFVTNYLNGIGGWQMAFAGFALPIALAASIIVYRFVPSPKVESVASGSNQGILSGFRQVFSNRSATACLIGQAMSMATWGGILTFVAAFWRQVYGLSIGTVVLISMVGGLGYIAGNLIAGRYANKFGRKRLVVVSLFAGGISMALWTSINILWVAVGFSFLGTILGGGIRGTAINSYILEQIPTARGTLMSLNGAAQSLGNAIGVAVGGYLLIAYGYTTLFYAYSLMFILGGLVIAFLTAEAT
jgi:predicted MFS family arabinose efflux permease